MKKILYFIPLGLLSMPFLTPPAHAQWNSNPSLFGGSSSDSSSEGTSASAVSSGGEERQKQVKNNDDDSDTASDKALLNSNDDDDDEDDSVKLKRMEKELKELKEEDDEKPSMSGGYIDQFGLPRAQMKVINGRAMLMAPPKQEKRFYGVYVPPPPRAPDDGRATGSPLKNTGSVTGSNRDKQNKIAKEMKAKLPYPDQDKKDDDSDSDDDNSGDDNSGDDN